MTNEDEDWSMRSYLIRKQELAQTAYDGARLCVAASGVAPGHEGTAKILREWALEYQQEAALHSGRSRILMDESP